MAILFKILDDIKPEYLAIAFDLKAPTHRHKLYDGYKANRKGMPNELAMQMPILKEVLTAMNIKIIEKEGYEADDILGTLAKWGEKQKLSVTILTGDRDSFQLIEENIKVRIPHTSMGKTTTEDYTVEKVLEKYGLEPLDLIQVKALQGDASDNIPGVPGIGEKTALSIIKEYKTVDNLYKNLEENTDNLKGKTREKFIENKELAYLSRTLGTIDINVPLGISLQDVEQKEWNVEQVLEMFKKLKFNRYIERFSLVSNETKQEDFELESKKVSSSEEIIRLKEKIINDKKMFYYLDIEQCDNLSNSIINRKIKGIYIYIEQENKVYLANNINEFKEIFENIEILKCGYKQKEEYILFNELNIEPKNLMFDIAVAGYVLNSTINKYTIEYLSSTYLNFDIDEKTVNNSETNNSTEQISLFESNDEQEESISFKKCIYAYLINKLFYKMKEELKNNKEEELFNDIEMPLVEVLANMQINGMYVDKQELMDYGRILQDRLLELTKEIYELAGEEFNINSTKQLGELLFKKLKLSVVKKNKTGYSTDVDVLEKIKNEHPIIEKILEYRQLAKLNSTYVEGLIPCINKYTNRIHSSFHQTVTATGRISSTDPNLQNIPTRIELGKKLRKIFKAEGNSIFIDADYSQIELRILAHISNDENMIQAFNNNEDIHKQAASKVFNIPLEEVTKEERSKAKAVNFGIVYGISDFGLAEQIGVSRKLAKQYIEQYLEKYNGIKEFMNSIVEKTKELGYVETLFNRRRYVPEISSNNYMVRQFGNRVAMNTPIQGTAADIMKIAMIKVYNALKENNLKSKLVLQVHDELLIETKIEEKEIVKKILKESMENVIKLSVPLVSELEEGKDWYEAK